MSVLKLKKEALRQHIREWTDVLSYHKASCLKYHKVKFELHFPSLRPVYKWIFIGRENLKYFYISPNHLHL